MTDQQHSITPPPELVQQLAEGPGTWMEKITAAYRAGADQELEACCEWLKTKEWIHPEFSDELHAARRPKPLTLAEQAFDSWDRLKNEAWCEEIDFDLDLIRRALERLQELENND